MPSEQSFLPDDFVLETRERRTGLIAAVLFPVMIIAIFAAFLFTNRQWNDVRTLQETVGQRTEKAAKEIAEMRNLERIRAQMNEKAALARGLIEPVPRSALLALLINTMPEGVTLLELDLRSEIVKPPKPSAEEQAKAAKEKAAKEKAAKSKGAAPAAPERPAPIVRRVNIVIVGAAPSLLEVGRWMTALERIPILSGVRLELMEEKDIDGLDASQFRMSMSIEPQADLRRWLTPALFKEITDAQRTASASDGGGGALGTLTQLLGGLRKQASAEGDAP
ncbi:MAG: hypothetical protein GC172_11015 [Phycisphaera sp.]|nr:hypothetical protein [Phycisphaera sp.]